MVEFGLMGLDGDWASETGCTKVELAEDGTASDDAELGLGDGVYGLRHRSVEWFFLHFSAPRFHQPLLIFHI